MHETPYVMVFHNAPALSYASFSELFALLHRYTAKVCSRSKATQSKSIRTKLSSCAGIANNNNKYTSFQRRARGNLLARIWREINVGQNLPLNRWRQRTLTRVVVVVVDVHTVECNVSEYRVYNLRSACVRKRILSEQAAWWLIGKIQTCWMWEPRRLYCRYWLWTSLMKWFIVHYKWVHDAMCVGIEKAWSKRGKIVFFIWCIK